MAWRFKVSKYKNAVGIVPRKEDWLSDLKVGSPQSCGNHIKASAAFMAFNVENRGGGSLCVMPLTAKGRLDPNSPLLHAHSDLITDFDFSPFDDGMLATGSTDANVHIWHIPEGGLHRSLCNPEYSLPQFDKRIENILFHPTTEFILTIACYDTIRLFDILQQRELCCCRGPEDQIQGIAWKMDGRLLASSARDHQIRVFDPRAGVIVQESAGHSSTRDSRVQWLNDSTILSTGHSQARLREVWLHDTRSMARPYKSLSFDSSTGTLMPLYDVDTRMLFLAGKADVSIMYWELMDKEPHLIEGYRHGGSMQTKGACLVPKRGLDVMAGEVNRLLQLTNTAVIPITYQVPRKTYREFHADLFPPTRSSLSAQTVQQWWAGGDAAVVPTSLDPGQRSPGEKSLQMHRGPLSKRDLNEEEVEVPDKNSSDNGCCISNGVGVPVPAPRTTRPTAADAAKVSAKPTVAVKPSLVAPRPALRSSVQQQHNKDCCFNSINSCNGNSNRNGAPDDIFDTSLDKEDDITKDDSGDINNETDGNLSNHIESSSVGSTPLSQLRKNFEASEECPSQTVSTGGLPAGPSSPTPQRRPGPTRSRSFRRICKFRHLAGTTGHRNTHLENLRDLCRTTPGESDGITCNSSVVVLPLSGAAGRVAVLKHAKGGRLPDGVLPAFLCPSTVLDFALNPFDDTALLTGCDDGNILQWRIPEGGLQRPCNEPELVYCAGPDKVTLLKFHPLAADVLATVCGDYIIRVWDLVRKEVAITLDPHPDQVFAAQWSPCGVFLATLCRDGLVRVFDPRKSVGPCREGKAHQGVRGGRILWALEGKVIITCGSSKTSMREISVFKSSCLDAPLTTLPLDQSPAILTPYCDQDSSTLFITAKGESTIYCYEVGLDAPYLFPLSHHRAATVHQGLTFLPKRCCDVRVVEFARALRLTRNTLEPLHFTVPRVKTQMFQDDLFPPTPAVWEPQLTATSWCSGSNATPRLVSLCPEDMEPLSNSRASPPNDGDSASHDGSSQNGGSASHHGGSPALVTNSTSRNSSFDIPFIPHSDSFGSRIKNLPEAVRETQNKLEHSMSEQISVSNTLEQDTMEGVDNEEWLED